MGDHGGTERVEAWRALRAAADTRKQAEEDLEEYLARPKRFWRMSSEDAGATRRTAATAAVAAYGDAVIAYAAADPTLSALADDLVVSMVKTRAITAELGPLNEEVKKTVARLQAMQSPHPRTLRAVQIRSGRASCTAR